MKIEFVNSNPLSASQIKEVEALIGLPVPDSISSYYKQYGGAEPQINGKSCCINNTRSDGYKLELCIERIDDYLTLVQHIGYALGPYGYLEEMAVHFELGKDYVETEFLFPICLLLNGAIYVAINGIHIGKIYIADTGDFGINLHAESLEMCLAGFFSCD